MSAWVIVPCDVCNKQTITEAPDEMVVCEGCEERWDAEPAQEVPVLEDDDGFYNPPNDDVPF